MYAIRRTLMPLAALLFVAVLSIPAMPQDDTGGCFDRVDRQDRVEILLLVNRERQKNGLPPLACDGELSAIAEGHAADMARRGYFSHTSPEGKDPFDRLREAGITYRLAGENISWNTEGTRSVVRLWMGSPRHKQNILGDFTKAGVGSYRGYYVLLLTGD